MGKDWFEKLSIVLIGVGGTGLFLYGLGTLVIA